MHFSDIDNGKSFDWGNTSKDYAKYRDVYPAEFFQSIIDLGLCKEHRLLYLILGNISSDPFGSVLIHVTRKNPGSCSDIQYCLPVLA